MKIWLRWRCSLWQQAGTPAWKMLFSDMSSIVGTLNVCPSGLAGSMLTCHSEFCSWLFVLSLLPWAQSDSSVPSPWTYWQRQLTCFPYCQLACLLKYGQPQPRSQGTPAESRACWCHPLVPDYTRPDWCACWHVQLLLSPGLTPWGALQPVALSCMYITSALSLVSIMALTVLLSERAVFMGSFALTRTFMESWLLIPVTFWRGQEDASLFSSLSWCHEGGGEERGGSFLW